MVVSIAFVSQALAVLRPLFPAKAGPPFGNEAIVKGNGSIQPIVKKAPAKTRDRRWISGNTQAVACVTGEFSPLMLRHGRKWSQREPSDIDEVAAATELSGDSESIEPARRKKTALSNTTRAKY